MSRNDDRIALIGLGLVGEALAHRLTHGGFIVQGWDVAESRRNALSRSLRIASSAADAVADAGVVILALPDTPALQAVIDDIAPRLASGAVVIDTGTNDPDAVVRCATRLAARSVSMLDVPLSGSSEQIRRGDAVAMAGGPRDAWERCARAIEAITPRSFHLGDTGSGSRAKLASNLLLGLNRAALAEALVFAEALDIDLGAFLAMLRETPAYSRAIDAKGEKMRTRDYTPQSRIRQHRKDLALMLDAARTRHIALPLTTAHASLLDAAIAAGDGELDNAAIIETIRRCRTPAS